MYSRRSCSKLLLSSFTVGLVCFAYAFPAAAEKTATAEALFERGIALLDEKKYERACPFLEESYRRDPLLGALIALADCEYERGRLSVALKRYQEYVDRHANLADRARVKQGSRLQAAKIRVEELKTEVPSIKIVLPPEAKTPILHLDGNRIKPNEAYPLDPGTYEVTLDQFERKTTKQIVELKKGEKKIIAMKLGQQIPRKTRGNLGPNDSHAEPFDYAADDFQRKVWTGVAGVELALVIVVVLLGPRSLEEQGTVNLNGGAPSAIQKPSNGPATQYASFSANPMVPMTIGAGMGLVALGGFLLTSAVAQSQRSVSITHVVHIGTLAEQPTFIGFQGRF